MSSIQVNRFYEVPEENDFVLVGQIIGDVQPGDFIRVPYPGKPRNRFNVLIERIEFSCDDGENDVELHVRTGPNFADTLRQIHFIGGTFEVEDFRNEA